MPRKYISVAERRARGLAIPSYKRKPGAPPNPQADARSKTAQMAQTIRWALCEANKTAVIDLISSMPTSESLPLLQLMRDNLDAACKTVQQKIDSQERNKEKCEYCGGSQVGRGWRMVKAWPNPYTRQLENHVWCSDSCVVLWNQKKRGGIAAMPDRGGKFGPDQPLKSPDNGVADAGPDPVREVS